MIRKRFVDEVDDRKRIRLNPDFSFPVKRNEDYEGSFPIYKQPQELTSYSIDHERRVWFDDRELKYYHPLIESDTKDLNTGYEKMIKRDENIPEHIDTLLDALTFSGSIKNDKPTADVVTWRGIMTKLLCTPYARREPWKLRASRYNDTIYIEEVRKEETMTEKNKLMSFWGYRFETLCTDTKPPSQIIDSKNDAIVNTNVQYCVVVKTKLGNNSIIMGAEVDCCKDIKPKDPVKQLQNYIELKTSRVIETDRNLYSFERYKLLKFWAQSFLIGLPSIICGFRDDEGKIVKVKEYKTLEIPRMIRNKPNLWNPSVCLNFANSLLDWLRLMITENDVTVTYSIEFEYPFREIKLKCTSHTHIFLTQRYLDGTVEHEIGGERVRH
ncbi:MAG: RAI1 like PD-XK nuclease-domain-containing protein [Benjaminiella poitrasii]|nr:MAG: RAI1 like PD-XK nuclease-domain-containing protein [Benjaminiella poitrasii]